MKYNVGEIFKYIDEWYQCVERPSDYKGCPCDICSLNAIGCYGVKECDGSFRTDKKSVVFKKLEKEECENKLKTFNLEEAKAGKPVYTRDGRKARIICFDCKDEAFPIVALVSGSSEKEEVISYDKDGFSTTRESKDILFMLPERKEGWVNVYNDTPIYDTKERAELGALTIRKRIATVKISWEE